MNYQELQIEVFNWLQSKHTNDNSFTFSLRRKASKGAELNYFIGTEKSKYFSTTFWNIPIGYPGSSTDLISLVFDLKNNKEIDIFFKFNQTKNPHDAQNKSALKLIENLRPKLIPQFSNTYVGSGGNKMETFAIGLSSKFKNFKESIPELEKFIEIIVPIVNEEIENLKNTHPDFIANRFTQREQIEMIEKMEKRFENHRNKDDSEEGIFLDTFNKVSVEYIKNYYSVLTRLANDLNVSAEDSRTLFSVPKSRTMLNFIINHRYIWTIHFHNHFYKFIAKRKITEYFEEFKGSDKKFLNYTNDFSVVLENYNEILECAREELNKNFQNASESNLFFVKSVFDENYFSQLIGNISVESEKIIPKMSQPLNQILFGPPGTGKTYNTINKAIAIANPDFDLTQNRNLIKAEYQRLVDESRIVFTTFHQSLSYEDFIEGIKPKIQEDEDENKSVFYEIEDGIFKEIVANAKTFELNQKNDFGYGFDEAWDELLDIISEKLQLNQEFKLPILTPNMGISVTEITGKGNLKVKPWSGKGIDYIVSYKRLKNLQNAFPDLSVVKNIDKEFRSVIGGSNSTAYWAVLNYLNHKIQQKPRQKAQVNEKKNFVLIIDEINRGNVSQIFGELITLIESDKRLGNSESLQITLPYSKEKFGVPRNLYIIGTMNTADRSVEALDTALRRRFSFEEMPPKYDLEELNYEIAGFQASEILKTINSRIEKLIDKDHAIGHAYFIGKDENSIVESFYKNIIPLLQEYFFGDYGKIGLVLGKGFVRIKEKQNASIFASFDYENESDYLDKLIYEIIDYRTDFEESDFLQAIQILMNFQN